VTATANLDRVLDEATRLYVGTRRTPRAVTADESRARTRELLAQVQAERAIRAGRRPGRPMPAGAAP